MKARIQQRGVAIVLAMATVALATIAATAILVTQSTWARESELTTQHVQAQSLVRAGIDWACAVLSDDRRSSNVDHLGEPWALRLAPMPVEKNGMMHGHLEDQQARFNLNNLVSEGKINETQVAHFRRLLSILGIHEGQARVLTDSLVDWIDADPEERAQGAEDPYYLSLHPPYLAANRPLTDVTELARIAGFDDGVRARLRPFVSALPRFTSVNVNTAPPEVLAAIVERLSLDDARSLTAQRERVYFRDRSDFLNALPRGAAAGTDISVGSDYFRVWLSVTIGEAESSGSALLARQEARWPAVVWRKMP